MGGHLNVNHLIFLGQGALWTIGLSLIALAGGGIVGFVIALARISPLRSIRLVSAAYVQLVQGTPLLVILFLGYFGLAAVGIRTSSLVAARPILARSGAVRSSRCRSRNGRRPKASP